VQRQYLAATGAERGQGYLFSRPLPKHGLTAYFAAKAGALAA